MSCASAQDHDFDLTSSLLLGLDSCSSKSPERRPAGATCHELEVMVFISLLPLTLSRTNSSLSYSPLLTRSPWSVSPATPSSHYTALASTARHSHSIALNHYLPRRYDSLSQIHLSSSTDLFCKMFGFKVPRSSQPLKSPMLSSSSVFWFSPLAPRR